MVAFKPVLRLAATGFLTFAIRILMVLEEGYPLKLLVKSIVRLAGVGGFATLLPNSRKQTGLLFDISLLVCHSLQSKYLKVSVPTPVP